MIANPATLSTLNTHEREALQFMREEEKLARDVYLTLYSLWRLPVFSNIAASEQRHTDAVQGLLQTYGIPGSVYPNSGNVTRMGGGKRMGQGRGMAAATPASHDHAAVRQGNAGNGCGGWGRGHHGMGGGHRYQGGR